MKNNKQFSGEVNKLGKEEQEDKGGCLEGQRGIYKFTSSKASLFKLVLKYKMSFRLTKAIGKIV